jgi:hypothetical protein
MNCQEFSYIQLKFTKVEISIEYQAFELNEQDEYVPIGMVALQLLQEFDTTENFGTNGEGEKNRFSGKKQFVGNRSNTDGFLFNQPQLQQCGQWRQGTVQWVKDFADPDAEPFQTFYVYPEQQYIRRNYDCKYAYEIIGKLYFVGLLSGGGLNSGLVAGYDVFGQIQPIVIGGYPVFLEMTRVDVIGDLDVGPNRYGNIYAEPWPDGKWDAYSWSQRKRIDQVFDDSVQIPGDQAVGPEVLGDCNLHFYVSTDDVRKPLTGFGDIKIPWSIKKEDGYSKQYDITIPQFFLNENNDPVPTGELLRLHVKFTTTRTWVQEYLA